MAQAPNVAAVLAALESPPLDPVVDVLIEVFRNKRFEGTVSLSV